MASLSKTMKKAKQTQNRQLMEKAEKNTTIQKGSRSKGFDTLQEGIPLEHDTKQKSVKRASYEGQVFGMSKGITKNMDNYESLRVDCWLSDSVREDETLEEAFARVESVIDQVLEEAVLRTIEE